MDFLDIPYPPCMRPVWARLLVEAYFEEEERGNRPYPDIASQNNTLNPIRTGDFAPPLLFKIL